MRVQVCVCVCVFVCARVCVLILSLEGRALLGRPSELSGLGLAVTLEAELKPNKVLSVESTLTRVIKC